MDVQLRFPRMSPHLHHPGLPRVKQLVNTTMPIAPKISKNGTQVQPTVEPDTVALVIGLQRCPFDTWEWRLLAANLQS